MTSVEEYCSWRGIEHLKEHDQPADDYGTE